MKTVENGNNVELHYKGTFPDGEVFDSSWDRGETMNILVGHGRLIKGFESALLGMTEGETKTINLTADEAYGPVMPEAIISVPKEAFPENFAFEEGVTSPRFKQEWFSSNGKNCRIRRSGCKAGPQSSARG